MTAKYANIEFRVIDHHESLKEDYNATIFRLIPKSRNYISIKLNSVPQGKGNSYISAGNQIEIVKDNWDRFFPGIPFDCFFLSDHYEHQYKAENQFLSIFGLFSVLAVIIACLGLFGLSSFIIIRRSKEIGIRKISGAGVGSILYLVSGDFFKLVFAGLVIAAPLTWYLADNWLRKFPFRVDYSWAVFLLAALILFLISALTISYNTMVISYSNPAKAIKHE